jgi:hypothetical protein
MIVSRKIKMTSIMKQRECLVYYQRLVSKL